MWSAQNVVWSSRKRTYIFAMPGEIRPYHVISPIPQIRQVESLAVHQISLSSSKVSGRQNKNLRGPQHWAQLLDIMIRDMDSRLGYTLPTKLACKMYFVSLSK